MAKTAATILRRHLRAYLPDQEDRQALLSMPLAGWHATRQLPAVRNGAGRHGALGPGITVGNPTPQRSLDQMSAADLARRHREVMGLMHTGEDAYKKAQPELRRSLVHGRDDAR